MHDLPQTTKTLDLMALYLGKISSDNLKGIENLDEISKLLNAKKEYDGTIYNIFKHNCRTFVHKVAHELGVDKRYREVI
jgi:hypothetical protein